MAFNKIDDPSFRIAEERLPVVLSATSGPPGKGGGKSEIPQPKVDNATNQAVHQMRMNNEDFLKRQEAMLQAQAAGQIVKDEDKGKGKGKPKCKGKGEAQRGAPWVAGVKAFNQSWNGGKAPPNNHYQQEGDWNANNKRSDPGWGNNWTTPKQQRQHW